MAPAGVAPGGIVLALPPPMYRQEAPRSKVFTEQAVSESIAPVNGMDAGLEKPAPPQLVVPAVVVYLSERPDGAQVVLVVLGAALLVVVVAAACPSEGATLSQKRAATTVVVRITVPMTSSVLPRGQAPRESCSSANRRYQGDAD